MRRLPASILSAALPLIVMLFPPRTSLADSARGLVAGGNRSFEKGDFEKAVELYEKASVKAPESPIVTFNLGDAFYRLEDYKKAREYFGEAALKSKDLSLEAKAWYNMGNSAFREAQRQAGSDIKRALELYRESVEFYSAALEKDAELDDAAYNIEVTRLVIKDLLDRLKRQQDEMEKQREEMQEVVDSLLALIGREEKAVGRSGELGKEGARSGEGWEEEVGRLKREQEGILDATGSVSGKLRELFPGEPPQPVERASSHLDSSVVDQDEAIEDLEAKSPGGAVEDQEGALEHMRKALAELAQDQPQPQGGRGEEGEQEEQAQREPREQAGDEDEKRQEPRDETAEAIIDEEKENRKQRMDRARGAYRSVEKDW